MLSLYDLPSMLAALERPLEPTLHRLLSDRIHDAIACGLGDMTHIIVVAPSDQEADFLREAAFSPFWNPTFAARYGPRFRAAMGLGRKAGRLVRVDQDHW